MWSRTVAGMAGALLLAGVLCAGQAQAQQPGRGGRGDQRGQGQAQPQPQPQHGGGKAQPQPQPQPQAQRGGGHASAAQPQYRPAPPPLRAMAPRPQPQARMEMPRRAQPQPGMVRNRVVYPPQRGPQYRPMVERREATAARQHEMERIPRAAIEQRQALRQRAQPDRGMERRPPATRQPVPAYSPQAFTAHHRGPMGVEEEREAAEARRREVELRGVEGRQIAFGRRRAEFYERERRRHRFAEEQRYLADLQAQEERLEAERDYDVQRRYLSPGAYYPRYRYRRGHTYYQTSEVGAEALRQAVEYGYDQGYRAGSADRYDGARFDYDDDAYEYADYGYNGLYVPEGDYSYYFREGYQRGYEDGYYGQYQYGTLFNGRPSILAAVLSSLLGLVQLR